MLIDTCDLERNWFAYREVNVVPVKLLLVLEFHSLLPLGTLKVESSFHVIPGQAPAAGQSGSGAMLSPHVPAVLFEIVIPVIAGAAIASGLNASAASSNMPCKTDWFEMCVAVKVKAVKVKAVKAVVALVKAREKACSGQVKPDTGLGFYAA